MATIFITPSGNYLITPGGKLLSPPLIDFSYITPDYVTSGYVE